MPAPGIHRLHRKLPIISGKTALLLIVLALFPIEAKAKFNLNGSVGFKRDNTELVAFEATLFDSDLLFLWDGGGGKFQIAYVAELSGWRGDEDRLGGIGLECFTGTIPHLHLPSLLPMFVPNPQIMVYAYPDGTFNGSASLFLMLPIIPYVEYEFKTSNLKMGAMLKMPILLPGFGH